MYYMRVDSLEKIIFQKIKEIDTIEKYEKFLEFYGRGNIYCFSAENTIAIFAQNPDATLVGTYDMWKRYGRYPLKNVGIAVYPYNTSGVFGKFADYLYDVKDTKNTTEREISVWQLSEEQKKEYFQWKQEMFYREEAKGFLEYLKLQFYEDVRNSLEGEHSDLLYGEQKVFQDAAILLCESITKVYMTRCGAVYQMSEEADKYFHALFSDDDIMKSMFLMKCIKVVQEIAHKEIQQVNYYFRKEREIRKNGRESKQAVTNSSRVRGNVENTSEVGVADRKISHGKISGTNSDSVSEPRNGEIFRPESRRGEGILSEDVPENARKREGLEDGNNGKDTKGKSDSTGDPKQDRTGDIIPTNHVLETQTETQLNMFTYMNSVTDNNIATSDVTPDGLGIAQESIINPLPVATAETSKDTGIDFYYSDDWKPNDGSDAERYLQNLEAIRVLKKLEQEERQADYEEQTILSKYVGWGGLSKYFDENTKSVQKQYEELKNLLTEEEYKSAKASVTDSFYTPKEVLDGVYQALDRFGFKGGNVLEPSMGIGNFFSAMPKEMKENSALNGVEIDSISGRIAKFLHPNCNIQISGIENAQLQADYYDVVIGNVPFGDYKVNDRKYNKENFLIHDYFFAKAIEHCAPGGIICFITSKGTLDKKNPAVRKYISERAEFVGAIRLPNTTFRDSANTEATSDLIFLRKKERAFIIPQEFEFVEKNEEGVQINSYYISHPDMMLGHMEVDTKRFGESRAISYLAPDTNQSLSEGIYSAVNKLPSDIYVQITDRKKVEESYTDDVIPADSSVKNYTYAVREGKLYMREDSSLLPQSHLPGKVKA